MFFLTSYLSVYSQFSDDFSDGNFIQNPTWTGEVSKFKVSNDFKLQLNAPKESGSAYLSTASKRMRNTSWEFSVQMNFNPTTSNYSKIYLCSSNQALTDTTNGFFVRLGYTDKNISLLSQNGSKTSVLVQGDAKRIDLTSVSVRIKVTLDKQGNFNLYSKLSGESDYKMEGNTQISNYPPCNYFGIVCTHTSTRNESFLFDDFEVKLLDDDDTLPTPEPEEITTFGTVVFSEIMAKPSTGNPEYVELYNCSDKTISLKNWQFYYGDKPYNIPDGAIKPHGYFILTKNTVTSSFPNTIDIAGISSFPDLANTGKLLKLSDNKDNLVHWFEYSEKMYQDDEKKTKGGWSLECIDFDNTSNTASNWKGSVSEGGTPGLVNSVKAENQDKELPEVVSSIKEINDTLKITFSKPINLQSLSDKKSYHFNNEKYEISYVDFNYPQGTEVKLKLNQMPPKGELIQLNFQGLYDLSGFHLPETQTIPVGSGQEADSLDVVFNELMPNPQTDSNEYIELYNRSQKAIDLSFLSVASRKNTDGTLNKAYPLASVPTLFHPGKYLLITKSRDKVCNFYQCKQESYVIELAVMPVITNTSGCVVLINNQSNTIVDEFFYNEKMHNENVKNKKGVSLERIDINGKTDNTANWTSSSSDSGFGTPGYENSQKNATNSAKDKINITAPDLYTDNYNIHYKLSSANNRCRIMAFDALGKLINTIADNHLLGTEGSIQWNGKSQTDKNLQPGVYIIYVEIISQNGEISKFKLPCIISK